MANVSGFFLLLLECSGVEGSSSSVLGCRIHCVKLPTCSFLSLLFSYLLITALLRVLDSVFFSTALADCVWLFYDFFLHFCFLFWVFSFLSPSSDATTDCIVRGEVSDCCDRTDFISSTSLSFSSSLSFSRPVDVVVFFRRWRFNVAGQRFFIIFLFLDVVLAVWPCFSYFLRLRRVFIFRFSHVVIFLWEVFRIISFFLLADCFPRRCFISSRRLHHAEAGLACTGHKFKGALRDFAIIRCFLECIFF